MIMDTTKTLIGSLANPISKMVQNYVLSPFDFIMLLATMVEAIIRNSKLFKDYQ